MLFFNYLAYSLGIRSSLFLPELIAGNGKTDVEIRPGRVDCPGMNGAECYVHPMTDDVYLYWQEVGTFLVRSGTEIVVDTVPAVDEGDLHLCILGPALAVLLRQRGLLVLHASAVQVAHGAIAFLASSGGGKSTLAASFYTRGHAVVTDDVTAVKMDTDVPEISPGFPQLKLWPEAAAALGYCPDTLLRTYPQLDKHILQTTRGFPAAPLPLKRIYVVHEGINQEIEPLNSQQAFLELLRHTYGNEVLHTLETSAHFLQCANLVNHVPMRRLKMNGSLAALPLVTQMIEEDLARV